MFRRPIVPMIIASAVTLLLASCGTSPGPGGDGNGDGNGDGDGNGAQVTKLGFVSLYATMLEEATNGVLDAGSADVDGGGVFFETSEPLPAAFLDDPFQEELEQCQVFDLGVMPDPDPMPEPPGDLTFTTLDAGATLDVMASGSAYASFSRQTTTLEGDTYIVYEFEENVSGALPAALSLTVPGADFPGFAEEPFPSAPAFALTTPEDGSGVTVDTEFAWEPSGVSGAHVTLDMQSGDFSTFVSCITADDGSFEFPAETKTELGGAFAGRVIAATRTAGRVVVEHDAALVLSTSSTQEFPVFVFTTDD